MSDIKTDWVLTAGTRLTLQCAFVDAYRLVQSPVDNRLDVQMSHVVNGCTPGVAAVSAGGAMTAC